jgi:hypothetical protein
MAQIICLANSKKHGERCIAGIETSTGKWIRPVSNLDDGRVPRDICLVNGEEPKPLDILEIPLAITGSGYECENCSILPGRWRRVGQASLTDLVQYCEQEIIHSQWLNAVPFSFLQSLPLHQRRTLQLIRTTKLSVFKYQDTGKWEASLPTVNEQRMRAKITDLNLIDKLNQGITPKNECLVTISLGQPWRRTDAEELFCWKLIAGVIELSVSDSIWFEMKRVGWSVDRGQEYLQRTYNKRSRQQLTPNEMSQFLSYLKSLPTPTSSSSDNIDIC